MVGTVYKKRRKSLYDNGIQLLPTVRNAEVEGSIPFCSTVSVPHRLSAIRWKSSSFRDVCRSLLEYGSPLILIQNNSPPPITLPR